MWRVRACADRHLPSRTVISEMMRCLHPLRAELHISHIRPGLQAYFGVREESEHRNAMSVVIVEARSFSE